MISWAAISRQASRVVLGAPAARRQSATGPSKYLQLGEGRDKTYAFTACAPKSTASVRPRRNSSTASWIVASGKGSRMRNSRVAMDTAEGQVRERVAPAVLTGDDMVDLVSQPGSGLGELTVLAAMPSPSAHMLLRLRHRLALRLNSCSERRALDWRIMSSLLTRRYSSSSALSSSDRDPSAAFVESRSTRCLSSASKSSVKMARAASGESVPCPGFTTRPQMADAVLLGLTGGCMELPRVKSLLLLALILYPHEQAFNVTACRPDHWSWPLPPPGSLAIRCRACGGNRRAGSG